MSAFEWFRSLGNVMARATGGRPVSEGSRPGLFKAILDLVVALRQDQQKTGLKCKA